ncbi:hypothetical protein [Sinomicrobium soli]|uniref:hypothetical protein n=1 Tax=Sinomicrobium sp. N-1-3-6 TaxID=2219864 RepID=UPI0011BFAEC8|nr:hypothetical protein [Sinomicrobium sp. N-1-3-6]
MYRFISSSEERLNLPDFRDGMVLPESLPLRGKHIMMSRYLYLWGLFFLLLVNSSTAREKYETEKERLQAKIDAFMQPYRSGKEEALHLLLTRIEAGQSLPEDDSTYMAFNAFYTKNRKAYRKLRLQSLERYPAPPDRFPGYDRVPVSQLDMEQGALDKIGTVVQQLTNIRTLDVEESATVQYALLASVFKYLQDKYGLSLAEMMETYGCGSLIFTEKQDREHWQVTRVNRVYITRYRWNMETNIVDRVEVWVTDGEIQPAGWLSDATFKANTPELELMRDVTTCLWSLYDRKYHGIDTGCDSASGFLEANSDRYAALRNSRIGRLPRLPGDWEENYARKEDPVVDDLVLPLERSGDGTYRLSEAMSVSEFGYFNVLNHIQARLSENPADNIDFITSWLTGYKVYAMPAGKDVWRLTTGFGSLAFSFTWNIRTDAISDGVRYTRKPL